MVLLSDVWLDRHDILDRLHTIFAGKLAGGWVGACTAGLGAGPTGCTPLLLYGCCVAWAIGWPGRAVWSWAALGQYSHGMCYLSFTGWAHHPPPFPATGFSQLEQPPSLFVLMGNFQVREEGTFNSALTCASACSAVAYPCILCRDCCHSLCASSLPTVL